MAKLETKVIGEEDVVGLSFGLVPDNDLLRKAILDLKSTAAYYKEKSEAYFKLRPDSATSNDWSHAGVRDRKISDFYTTAAKNAILVLSQLRRDLEKATCFWLEDASDEDVDKEIRKTEEMDKELRKNYLGRLSPEDQARFKQFTGFSCNE